MSPDGMMLLTNYTEFDEINSRKPSIFGLFQKDYFQELTVRLASFRQPEQLIHDLNMKMQQLNGALDTVVFQLDIREINLSLQATNSKITKIEIQIGNIIRNLRVQRLFQMKLSFKDNSLLSIEVPVMLLDEIEQMELIRAYMLGSHTLEVVSLNSEVCEYMRSYNKNETLILQLEKQQINVSTKKKSATLELNRALLTNYGYNEFRKNFPNLNQIFVPPNILNYFEDLEFKLSVARELAGDSVRLFLQNQSNNISVLVKSTCTLKNKPISLQIEDPLDNILEQLHAGPQQEYPDFQQVQKKIKL